MDKTIIWLAEIMKELEGYTEGTSKVNITLPSNENQNILLVVSFFCKNKWLGFGITKEDLELSSKELVQQIVSDLKLNAK